MKYLFLFFLLCSCLKRIEGQNDFAIYLNSPEILKDLTNKCTSLNQEGNINDLRRDLDKNMKSLRDLTQDDDIIQNQEEIEEVGIKINQNILALEKILSPKYVTSSFIQKIDWKINETTVKEELKRFLTERDADTTTWKLKNFKVIKAYKNGIEDKSSIEGITINSSPSYFGISYKSNASVLDICQFQETLLFVFELQYELKEKRSPGSDKEQIKLKFGLHAENPTQFLIRNEI